MRTRRPRVEPPSRHLVHLVRKLGTELAQQLVANGVPEGVVDFLETVEVEEEHSEARTRRVVQEEIKLVVEPAAVGQSGEAHPCAPAVAFSQRGDLSEAHHAPEQYRREGTRPTRQHETPTNGSEVREDATRKPTDVSATPDGRTKGAAHRNGTGFERSGSQPEKSEQRQSHWPARTEDRPGLVVIALDQVDRVRSGKEATC